VLTLFCSVSPTQSRAENPRRRVSIVTMGCCCRRALRHALAGLLLALLSPGEF